MSLGRVFLIFLLCAFDAARLPCLSQGLYPGCSNTLVLATGQKKVNTIGVSLDTPIFLPK